MIHTIPSSPSPSAHRMRPDRAHTRAKEDLQPWTAARCHRLLRQLQCRIGALRKLVHEARQPSTRDATKRRHSDGDVITRPTKRTRYTYAQRRSTSSNTTKTNPTLSTPPRSVRTLGTMNIGRSSPATGRVDFSTPMLRKICSQPDAPGCTLRKTETPGSTAASLAVKLQSLRRIAPEGHYRIYETIFGWLSSLLRTSEAKLPVPHPKSLLGMCLRKVPAAVAEIEAWDRQVAKENGTLSSWDSSNASAELYEQLESFGSSGSGWKPLRLVLRAHALSMLVKAVGEGLFEPEFVSILAELYLSFKCREDAAAIVAAISSPIPKPRSSRNMLDSTSSIQPVATMVESLRSKTKSRAGFECLSELINNGKLPFEWLATKGFQVVWEATLQALSATGPEPSAIDFTRTVVKKLSSRNGLKEHPKKNTRKQTLVNVVSGLAATAIAFGGDYGPARSDVARRLMHLLDSCISDLQTESKTAGDGNLLVLVTARYLVTAKSKYIGSATRQMAEEECRHLLVRDDGTSSQSQYREALFLACSVAQCQGRACSIACHDALSWICSMLEHLGLPDWFRGGLRMDGAFLLAQKTNDLRDLAFAEKLPTHNKDLVITNTVFSGWRWEEGISEWVVSSPGSKLRNGTRNDGDGQGNADGSLLSARDAAPGRRERERGRVCVRELLGGDDMRIRIDASGVSQSDIDCDAVEEEQDNGDGESDDHGQEAGPGSGRDGGQDDSGDELSGDWDEGLDGICGLAVGNAARTTSIVNDGGDGDSRRRNPALTRGRSSHSNVNGARRSVDTENWNSRKWFEAEDDKKRMTTTTTTAKTKSMTKRLIGGRCWDGGEGKEGTRPVPFSGTDASQSKSHLMVLSSSSPSKSRSKSRLRSQLGPQPSSHWQSASALPVEALDVAAEAGGRGPRLTQRMKRAGWSRTLRTRTRTRTGAETGTGTGIAIKTRTRGVWLRGMSQRAEGDSRGGEDDDDWDELVSAP